MDDLNNLQKRVKKYNEILQNTRTYRQEWKDDLKKMIKDTLQEIIDNTELEAEINLKEHLENLEAIELSLGHVKSGLYEEINTKVKKHLIKHNGSLIYQQLFNGKVIVLIYFPAIEGYGEPRPPKTIAIYRPEEIKPAFILRHMEEFIKYVSDWEDYDDDEPSKKIGFKLNFESEEQS
ncbi:MAG TPA: hypothetical protein VJ917_05550 [Saprospiraceae bacterium]|nr:hypothetical protein [Saprospiraceae bacterium]